MEISSMVLLCDEELLLSSQSPSPVLSRHEINYCSSIFSQSSSPCSNSSATEEDCRVAFEDYVRRETIYAPCKGYAQQLQASSCLSAARTIAIRWIILACVRLNLALGTAFNAVNYLDRFISMNCTIKWEKWMAELLFIACISIASKMDEVCVPSLHDFQMEDLDHSFQPSTIQRMELAVLKALQWRVTCVTPYSYVEIMTWRMGPIHSPLAAHVAEILVRALLDPRLVAYDGCSVATSALRLALREIDSPGAADHISVLHRLIPVDLLGDVDTCQKIMEDGVATSMASSSWEKHHWCPLSPDSVVPMQRTEMFDCYVDIDACFSEKSKPNIVDHIKRSPDAETPIEANG